MKTLHLVFELPRETEVSGLLPQSEPSEPEQHCLLNRSDWSQPSFQGMVWGIFITTLPHTALYILNVC